VCHLERSREWSGWESRDIERQGRRLSEREASELNPAKLSGRYAAGLLDSARNDFYDSTPTDI